MISNMAPELTFTWGKPSTICRNKYWPITKSVTLFLIALVIDVLLAAALAEESPTQWMWGLALILGFVTFIASLRSDCFKLLHYVADRSGIHLQYQVAAGPLEKFQLVHRTKNWSAVRHAAYLSSTNEDETNTNIGVVLTLMDPIERGRTTVELLSDCPEQMMSLVNSQIGNSRKPMASPDLDLVIA